MKDSKETKTTFSDVAGTVIGGFMAVGGVVVAVGLFPITIPILILDWVSSDNAQD